MNLGMIGIIVAYVLIALLLLSINLYSKWSWHIKAASIVLTSVFYVVTYYSIPALLGWPSSQYPPSKFRVIAAHVVQPDKKTDKEGKIYLWLTEIEDMTKDGVPRAYQLEYSDALYAKTIGVKAKLDKDIAQLGEFKRPDNAFNEVKEQKRGVKSTNIEFYDSPDPLFPDK